MATTPFDRNILDRFINDTIPSSLRDELYQPSPRQDSSQNLEMGQYERLFWVLIFSVMVLIAAGGNTIVVYIVSTNKEMKSVTNYFLVNLSLADTMVSTLNVIFNFISMLISHWPFGLIYCKISNFIAILSISASVFTLTAISCDRYNAILHPLRPRMSHSHAIGWILLIWTLSSALALPNLIFSTLVEDRLVDDDVAGICVNVWSDGKYPHSRLDLIYNIVVLVVTYLVPILTMAILYYKVGKELWGYEAIGENVEKQQRAILAKRKIVKMMIVVVIIFALCWLPYHAFFVINFYVPILQDEPLQYIRCYLFIYWLAMSNSMYNPIIIYFMNSNFRHEFKKILCLLFCCSTYTPPTRAINNINNHNNNNNNNNIINSNNNSNIRNHTHVKRQGAASLAQEAHNLKLPLNTDKENHHHHHHHHLHHIDRRAQGSDIVEVVVTSPSSRQLNDADHQRTVIRDSGQTMGFPVASHNCNEDEPFILHKLNSIKTNMTDLKQQDGEKLIDFSTYKLDNKHNLNHYNDNNVDNVDNDDDGDNDDDDGDRIGKVWI